MAASIQLAGRTAVVTGAGGGLGRALALALGAADMDLVAADLDETGMAATAEQLVAAGVRVLTIRTDVSDADSVEALAQRTVEEFGSVDVVCANAGIMRPGAIWEQSAHTWDAVLGVNLGGLVNTARAFVPRMIASADRGGNRTHFVSTVGTIGLFTAPFSPPGSYTVSKHAALAFTEVLFQELTLIGAPVGVTALCPSGVRSHIAADPDSAEGETIRRPELWSRYQALVASVAHGRDPADVADIAMQAIYANRFWAFPDPEHVSRAQFRADYILGGTDPTSPATNLVAAPSRFTKEH